jgi:spore germination cell wall hydrolase CwlJ-like protein
MRRFYLRWAVGVIAPWCLGLALLVSITADAGQNATIGGSLMRLNAPVSGEPDTLIPAEAPILTGDLHAFGLGREQLITPVSFDLGDPAEFTHSADEIEPRLDLKPHTTRHMPLIDRTHKGEPALGLRPTFDTQLRARGGAARFAASQWITPPDETNPLDTMTPHGDRAALDTAARFTPWSKSEDPQLADDETSLREGMRLTMRPAALAERLAQGATPKVSRAEALSSTTPAPADGTPVEVSFSRPQLQAPEATIVPRADGRPNYAALLQGEHGARERKCLAEAVYFESRSEPEDGQAAVAQVVLNRATSGLYPASICGVVYQNRSHYRACQFSFACEGKSLRITEPDAWARAVRIANEVIDGKTYLADVGGATHYHANYVRPGWARRLVKMDTIGHHIFYKLHPGQT